MKKFKKGERVRVIGDGSEDFNERHILKVGEIATVGGSYILCDGTEDVSCVDLHSFGENSIAPNCIEPVADARSYVFPLSAIEEGYTLVIKETVISFVRDEKQKVIKHFCTTVTIGKNGKLGFFVPGYWHDLADWDPKTLRFWLGGSHEGAKEPENPWDKSKVWAEIVAVYAPFNDISWREWDFDDELDDEDKIALRWNELRGLRWAREEAPVTVAEPFRERASKWEEVPEGLEVAKPKTFSERMAEAIYKEIVGELDKDEVVELNEYEMAFDFGEHHYADTSEQFQTYRDAIIAQAVRDVMDGYTAHETERVVAACQRIVDSANRVVDSANCVVEMYENCKIKRKRGRLMPQIKF